MKFKISNLKHGLWLVIFVAFLLGVKQEVEAQNDTVWTRMTQSSIKQITFSPNSLFIATGNNSAYVSIWDVNNGEELQKFSGASSNLALKFTNDGKYLAFGGGAEQGGVKIIDFEKLLEYKMIICPTNSLAFINNESLIAIGGRKDIRIWDFQTNEVIKYIDSIVQPDFGGSYYELHKMVYSPINNSLIYTATDGKLRFYSLTTNKIEYTYDAGYGEIAISDDSKYIAFKTGMSGFAILIMDVETRGIMQSIPGTPSGINSIAFSPDSKFLAVAYEYAKVLKIWDVQTGKNIYNYVQIPPTYFDCIDWSKNNQYITGGDYKILWLFKNKVNNIDEKEKFEILYPNPTSHSINIQFNLPKSDNINIEIISLNGKIIRNVFSGFLDTGEQKILAETAGIASGNYFIVIHSDIFSKTFKLIIE